MIDQQAGTIRANQKSRTNLIDNLTILIPTHDRPSQASSRLHEICTHLGPSVNVIVQVNPGHHGHKNINVPLGMTNLLINENHANIGVYASIVAGLSNVKTEWLWILGDDDYLREDIFHILEESMNICFATNTQAIIFNHWHQPQDGTLIACKELKTFTENTGFNDCLFISSALWKTSYIKSNVRILTEFSFTMASQAMIHLNTLVTGAGNLYLWRKPIVKHVTPPTWNKINFSLRINKIFYLDSLTPRKREIFLFISPSLLWALQTSLVDIGCSKQLRKWLSACFLNLISAFFNGGLIAGLHFSVKLAYRCTKCTVLWLKNSTKNLCLPARLKF